MEEIKRLKDEPTEPKTKGSPHKKTTIRRVKSKSYLEIEELEKEFRSKTKRPKDAKIGIRKLYSHLVTTDKTPTNDVKNKSPSVERPGKRMPMRLAKTSILSYF